jgi:hypothetical protein
MKYATEMSSGAVTYAPSCMKIGSVFKKLIGEYTDGQTAWRSHKPTSPFQNKESKP